MATDAWEVRALGDEVLATAAQYDAIEDRIRAFQEARLHHEVQPELHGYFSALCDFERDLLRRHTRALKRFLEETGGA